MARSSASSAALTSNTTSTPPATYEQALAELDRLVAQMEAGQLPLDQMLDGYKRGAELLEFCRSKLQAVEAQVKILEDGQLKSWVNP
jgi:exodeoxyribonuclease VII small subunit